MMAKNSVLFLLIFLIRLNSCESIYSNFDLSTQISSVEVDAAIKIIKSCFPDENRGTVLVGNSNDLDNRLLTELQPVIIVQDGSVDQFDKTHKLQLFIVLEKSNLTMNIQHLKMTRWWNHEGFFIILGDAEMSESCDSRTAGVLQTAWNMDILRGIYICTDLGNRPMIYTFNPFSKLAPEPWEKIQDVPQPSGDPWSVHKQKFSPNSIHCIALDFDKTLSMNNYSGITIGYDGNFGNEDEKIFTNNIFKTLHAVLEFEKMNDSHLRTQENGNLNSVIGKMLSNKEVDMSLTLTLLSYKKKVLQSNIKSEVQIKLLSHDRGPKSLLLQIYELFGWKLATFTVFISTLTVFAFKFLLKKTIGVGTMEILRLWLNGGFLSTLTGNPLRIYLFGVFVYVQIIQAVVSGSILGFQVHPHHLKNIDSIADLKEFPDYTIYGWPSFFRYVETNDSSRYVGMDAPTHCTNYLLNNLKSVCITIDYFSDDDVTKYHFYHSPELIAKAYGVFPMREDWPLMKRFNFVMRRMFESHLIPLPSVIEKKNESDDPSRQLKLEDFESPLKMLALGHALAIVCFIFELIWHKIMIRSRRQTRRVRIWPDPSKILVRNCETNVLNDLQLRRRIKSA